MCELKLIGRWLTYAQLAAVASVNEKEKEEVYGYLVYSGLKFLLSPPLLFIFISACSGERLIL